MPGEFDFIARHAPKGAPRADVLLGSGDDAALINIPAGHALVTTVDTLVCGKHFPVETSPYDIGWKSIAVNLSDLAAMGADAGWVTIALTMPSEEPDKDGWMAAFCAGAHDLATQCNVAVVGGDLTSGPLSVTVQAMGYVDASKALRRDAARVGDVIAVTGTLGDAALALHLLQSGQVVPDDLLQQLNKPMPRLAEGKALAGIAHAALDISDGLTGDLGHMLKASDVGARIHVDDIPRSPAFLENCPKEILNSLPLTGGDDYELCVTMPADSVIDGLTVIGEIEEAPGCRLLDAQGQDVMLDTASFDHFKSA